MRSLLPFACLAMLAGSSALSAGGIGDVARAELIPGWRDADGTHVAGLRISLAPGWKTYWRAPGDGGIPPLFNWSGSSNIASVDVHYPVPEVFDQNGMQSIGYHGGVVFPLRIDTRDGASEVSLRGEIEIGVCEEICVPVTLQVRAVLPVSGAVSPELQSALTSRPEEAGAIECTIDPIVDGLRLAASARSGALPKADIVVIEVSEPGVWVSQAEVRQSRDGLQAVVEMVPPDARPFALARSEVRMTVLSDGRAVEFNGCD